jgi:hypothetical protein
MASASATAAGAVCRGHHALAPAARRLHILADGQGIEEFVGDEKERPPRLGLETALPAQDGATVFQRFRLHAAQMRAGFHQHDIQAFGEIRRRLQRAQHVRHQGAAARPQFHQQWAAGAALFVPGLRQPQAQHLAEHLADLRRGDEIPAFAERVAGGVVAGLGIVQRHRHVLRHRDRALGRDQRRDARFEAHAAFGFKAT